MISMAKLKKQPLESLIKSKPTILPMGFAVGQVEDELIVIDFIDEFSGQPAIIESIAMPKSKAMRLSNALAKAVKGEDEQ